MTHYQRVLVGVACAGLAVCGPAPKSASADRIDISMGSSNRYLHSSSIDTVTSDDSHAMFSLGVGWQLNRVRLPGLRFAVDAELDVGGWEGVSFQRMQTETSLVSGLLGARAIWPVSGMTSFFGRAALGLTHVSLELRDGGSSAPYLADDRIAASTYVGGGLDFVPLRTERQGRETFGFGLRLEGGYFASTPVSMRAVPRGTNTADDAILIPTEEADLGSLNVSAWVARIALVARY